MSKGCPNPPFALAGINASAYQPLPKLYPAVVESEFVEFVETLMYHCLKTSMSVAARIVAGPFQVRGHNSDLLCRPMNLHLKCITSLRAADRLIRSVTASQARFLCV